MLNGCLPSQIQRLFKIKLLTKDGAFVEYWVALALTTIPENSGNLDPISKCKKVRKFPVAVELPVFSVAHIVSCTHIIPGIATGSKPGDGRNKQWIFNSHLHLATWNDVYN
jgi:hypothetical protein